MDKGRWSGDGTCGSLDSSLASSFLPQQLFCGTGQSAHSESCLMSGSVELQSHNKVIDSHSGVVTIVIHVYKQCMYGNIKERGPSLEPGPALSACTFDVVNDGDDVLSKQLWWAAAQRRRLNVLENGAKLCCIFFGGIQQISGQETIFGQGRTEDHKDTSYLWYWHGCPLWTLALTLTSDLLRCITIRDNNMSDCCCHCCIFLH